MNGFIIVVVENLLQRKGSGRLQVYEKAAPIEYKNNIQALKMSAELEQSILLLISCEYVNIKMFK